MDIIIISKPIILGGEHWHVWINGTILAIVIALWGVSLLLRILKK